MAQTSTSAYLANYPVAIISPQYCSSSPIDLAIVRKVMKITDGNFVVTDVNGNIIFKVKDVLLTVIHERRILFDSAGNPLVTLREKAMTAHSRWQAFRGDSKDENDMIFSAKTSSIIYLSTTLHVFLANNTTEEVCDFTVKANFSESSCVIYAGDEKSSTVIAQMEKKNTVRSKLFGKDHFMVNVQPNIDYAFIVALIVILDEINRYSPKNVAKTTMEIVTGIPSN